MKEELKNYGLSEKESEIYLACLKTGDTTANRLSEITGIRRSTVYEIIERLKKRGIVSSLTKNKKYYFIAAKPSALIEILKEKERAIKEILPDLNRLSESAMKKPKVELFEGMASIKATVLEILNFKEILVYGGSTVGDQIFGTFTANFAKKRVKNKTKMKAIVGKTIPAHMLEKDIAKLTETRTNPTFEDHKSVYFIFGDNLLIISMDKDISAVKVYNNPILIESQRTIFNLLWKQARS